MSFVKYVGMVPYICWPAEVHWKIVTSSDGPEFSLIFWRVRDDDDI